MRIRTVASAVALFASQITFAQVPTAQLDSAPTYVPSFAFDVASVRESPQAESYTVRFEDPPHNSLVNLANVDAENLLTIAFGVDRGQISGLPAMSRTFFNVRAKSSPEVDGKLGKLDDQAARLEKRHMLQLLLAERFKLKVHWEARQGLVYDLVTTKTGSKMKPAGTVAVSAQEQANFHGEIPSLYQRGNGGRGYEFIGHRCTMASLAQTLAAQMGAPVRDATGLTEAYDFVLQYKGALTGDEQDDSNAWPALDVALPEQLGLKLQSGKGERKFLVVDHFERPSDN